YKVFIHKEDEVLKEIFDKYYNMLDTFKNRHYAIAKWIVTEIRAKGYSFKTYSNNKMNLRPVKSLKAIRRKRSKDLYEEQIMYNLHRSEMEFHYSEFERLIH
ncbi:MAG: hypothetical protein WA143_06800, partial [Lutibacter sp.]